MKKKYAAPLCEVVEFNAQESVLTSLSMQGTNSNGEEIYTDTYDSHKRDSWYDSSNIWGGEEE